jgi:hypothetical protein
MIKSTMTNECASVAGRFDGHADMLKQCTWHHPMQQIQGHTKCPWKPPLGDYLLRIAPAAAKGDNQQNNIQTIHPLCWLF